MDAGLFLILPHSIEDTEINVVRKSFSWGDEEFPQDPPEYHWGNNCILKEDRLTKWIFDKLPEKFKEESFIHYLITGKCLDNLELEVNGKNVNWDGNHLLDIFVKSINDGKDWAIAFIWQWDTIDRIFNCNTKEALDTLCGNLDWNNNREGFVVYNLVEE